MADNSTVGKTVTAMTTTANDDDNDDDNVAPTQHGRVVRHRSALLMSCKWPSWSFVFEVWGRKTDLEMRKALSQSRDRCR
jgi:hypothetical protein